MSTEKGQSIKHRTEIWLAIIGLIGILVGAIIANWDKLFLDPQIDQPTLVPPSKGTTTSRAPVRDSIIIRAKDFVRGSGVALASGQVITYGSDVLLNAPPYQDRPNAAEFDFRVSTTGTYSMLAEYAAATARPVSVTINGHLVISNAMSAPTG